MQKRAKGKEGGPREEKGIIWSVLKWADTCVFCTWQIFFFFFFLSHQFYPGKLRCIIRKLPTLQPQVTGVSELQFFGCARKFIIEAACFCDALPPSLGLQRHSPLLALLCSSRWSPGAILEDPKPSSLLLGSQSTLTFPLHKETLWPPFLVAVSLHLPSEQSLSISCCLPSAARAYLQLSKCF